MRKFLSIFLLSLNLFGVNILILNSYSPNLKWTTNQSKDLLNLLLEKSKNPTIFIDFMHTKKFIPTEEREECFFQALLKKYKDVKQFDIIITTDDNALNFIRKYRKKSAKFKDAKIFFEGVNNLKLFNILNKNIYAGVFEKKNPLSNLNIALKLKPNLKTIYLISDKSNSGNKTIKQYRDAFKNIDKNINFVYIHSSNIDEILKKLQNYDKKSVLMLLTFTIMKKDNKKLTTTKTAQIISKLYHNPILVHNDVYTNIPNTNIVGGDCTDASQQALLNGEKVLEYLNGKPINKIGFEFKNANRIYLNVKNLTKLGIDAYNLDIPNAIFINKPTSLYELYKVQIWSVIIFIVLIILFLIILAKKNRDLHQYSKEIKILNSSLEEKIRKAIEENRKKDQIMFQQSKLASMGEMMGAIAHQWRQPLNVLAINIQMLEDMEENGEINTNFIENFVEKNMETIQFMSQTIDDFKDFFEPTKQKEIFKLEDSITEVLKLIEKQLQNYNISINISSDNSEIESYKSEFKQVILNLLNNSKEAFIENNIQNPQIDIEIKERVITFSDNAGGIPKEIQNRVFEPYFTTKDNGTGIGLYMSKIIIEEHLNGKISFIVEDNHTIFKISFKK